MESLRAFIAIDIKIELALNSKWKELKVLLQDDSIKWVDEHTVHLTLFFLGETPVNQLETIAHELEQSLALAASFKIVLNGFGFFGKNDSPKVIWIGISDSQHLLQLKGTINSTLSNLGINDSNGRFAPHITLGRVKQIKTSSNLNNFIKRNKIENLQEVEVSKVIFYQSILKPDGPVYKPLREIKLLSL